MPKHKHDSRLCKGLNMYDGRSQERVESPVKNTYFTGDSTTSELMDSNRVAVFVNGFIQFTIIM